ncbi:hypothetical protein Leryth_010650 [Lithospermum erythrorhizon]|nr:hypothetical protein Leryth_010650 [Lithospermum erythrorhizon]
MRHETWEYLKGFEESKISDSSRRLGFHQKRGGQGWAKYNDPSHHPISSFTTQQPPTPFYGTEFLKLDLTTSPTSIFSTMDDDVLDVA